MFGQGGSKLKFTIARIYRCIEITLDELLYDRVDNSSA